MKTVTNRPIEIKEECKQLPVSCLSSAARYQRPLNEKFIDKCVSIFDPHKVEVIRVSYRDGVYNILDGQHTAEILRRVYAPQDPVVWCKIYYDLTYEKEAEIFAYQRCERPITKYDRFNAMREAHDEKTILLDQIARSYGFILSSHAGDHTFGSPNIIERVYDSYGEGVLCRTLDLLNLIWQGRKEFLKCTFVFAFAGIIKIYGNDLDEAILKHLGTRTMVAFTTEAEKMSTQRNKRDYRAAIVRFYNEFTKRKLDPNKLE